MKTFKSLVLATSLFAIVSTTNAAEAPDIFKTNCATCHTIGKGRLVGPDLINVDQRHDEKWLNEWIRSSQTMVKNKDPKAVELFNSYNQIPMPDYPQLKEEEIKALLSYIKEQGVLLNEAAKAPAPAPEQAKAGNEPKKAGPDPYISLIRDNPVSMLLGALTLLLLGVVVVLSKALTSITKAGYRKDDIQ